MSYMNNLLAIRALVGRVPDVGAISDKVKAGLNAIEREAAGIVELIEHPDEMKSSTAIALLVNAEKATLRALITKTRGELLPAVEAWRTSQNAARLAKANLTPDEFAQELRNVFRQMDDAGRAVYMRDAIEAGDGAKAAAILNAPLELTGLTADELGRYRDRFLSRVAKGPDADADGMIACIETTLQCADAMAVPAASTAGHRELPRPLLEAAERASAATKEHLVVVSAS